jgi:hypothetical protein
MSVHDEGQYFVCQAGKRAAEQDTVCSYT